MNEGMGEGNKRRQKNKQKSGAELKLYKYVINYLQHIVTLLSWISLFKSLYLGSTLL